MSTLNYELTHNENRVKDDLAGSRKPLFDFVNWLQKMCEMCESVSVTCRESIMLFTDKLQYLLIYYRRLNLDKGQHHAAELTDRRSVYIQWPE